MINPRPLGMSYAQNYEDVLLWRAFASVREGTYIDIGAFDPTSDSVSKAFYDAGWRGLHADASADCVARLKAARPDEVVVYGAVTDAEGVISFHEFPETGLSTCIPEIAARHEAAGWENNVVKVPTIRLATLLDMMATPDVHWLKIDVEGAEAAVLRSWAPSKVRPWALVIESTAPNTQIPTHHEWAFMVEELGYHEVANDGLSRFYVHETHPELDAAFVGAPKDDAAAVLFLWLWWFLLRVLVRLAASLDA